MLPLMKSSTPLSNLRTLEARRFNVLMVRFDGRVYSFPLWDLARANQLSFFEHPLLMECELLIPVEPAANYDKLLMFKRAKALHPEIPDLEVANDISDLLSIERLRQTLRE